VKDKTFIYFAPARAPPGIKKEEKKKRKEERREGEKLR